MGTLHKKHTYTACGYFNSGLMKSLITVLCLSAFSTLSIAQTCNSSITKVAPDNRYVISDDTVNDTATHLIWARCSQGQTFNNTNQACEGSIGTYHWQDALVQAKDSVLAGSSDWRLPNIKELTSLVETACYNPSINIIAFPNTASSVYWSSSAYAGNSSNAWIVYFADGYDGPYSGNHLNHVRLVRGGQ